jgi:hypothetical protein
MENFKVYLESGKKRVFAGALDWPGWSRSGKDEESALQALVDAGRRYGKLMTAGGLGFTPPQEVGDLEVVERLPGSATTDFGGISAIPQADMAPLGAAEMAHLQAILQAGWRGFDDAILHAVGRELRKGPRGGGRDLERMIEHVIESDRAYLGNIVWKHKREEGLPAAQELGRVQQSILEALATYLRGELPTERPRGGKVWPVRYYIRTTAWHTVDHIWEIEDRIE